jgi:hypothetical protein
MYLVSESNALTDLRRVRSDPPDKATVPPEGIEPPRLTFVASAPESTGGGNKLQERIGLSLLPYQGSVLPLNYRSNFLGVDFVLQADSD